MSRSSNDGLGHRIHRGATRRIKRSWRSRRVSAVGRTGRSDAEDGVNQDHGPSKTARSTIRPRRVGHGRSPGPWTRGQMDHVDAGGPPTCPARFRSTSCEWTNGPHAGPIMRPTRRTMRGRSREPPAWSMDQAGTKYVVHAKAHAGAAMPAAPGPWAGQGTGDHTHARGSPSSFRKAVNKE